MFFFIIELPSLLFLAFSEYCYKGHRRHHAIAIKRPDRDSRIVIFRIRILQDYEHKLTRSNLDPDHTQSGSASIAIRSVRGTAVLL